MGARLKILFDTDNEAISEDPHGESIRILDHIKQQIEDNCGQSVNGNIRDINGNKIGQWELALDEYDEDEDEEEY